MSTFQSQPGITPYSWVALPILVNPGWPSDNFIHSIILIKCERAEIKLNISKLKRIQDQPSHFEHNYFYQRKDTLLYKMQSTFLKYIGKNCCLQEKNARVQDLLSASVLIH